jgi:arsenical pump membrane protein
VLGHRVVETLHQTWPPFVLVAGLLLIGLVAAADGLFAAVGGRLARTRLGPLPLLLSLLALVAVVTAVLNLDTAVVFLTPVLVHAARSRGLDERPFLYGSVFMANAASTLLPGSNLTNLLVLAHDPIGGTTFVSRTALAWLAGCALTALLVAALLRPRPAETEPDDVPPLRIGAGVAATACAAALVVALKDPALPVLGVGVVACLLRRVRMQLDLRIPAVLFVVAMALGTLARYWHGPSRLLAGSDRWATAAIAAAGSVAVNNLPAAVLFSAQRPPHAIALLLGLDIGPNLAVTGSLSAVLWWQAARSVGARPSALLYSALGLVLVPVTLAAAVAVS